jgi:hypothetical protein
MVEGKLRVHAEYGKFKADFEGSPEVVSIAFIDFLNKVYPAFKLANRLVFNPNLIKLAQALEGVIEYSPEGLILTPGDLTSEEAIVLSLLGVYVGNKLGLSSEESVSVTQIATVSGKALKTILNKLKGMIDDGLVERVGRGEYKIKSLGIKEAEKVLQDVKMRGHR